MPTIDLECDGIVSENFAVSINRAYNDDTHLAEALNSQLAVSTLVDLPADADAVTSATIFYRGGVNGSKRTASVDAKLLTSGGTMLVEEANDLSQNQTIAVALFNTSTFTSTSAGVFTPAMVNDMRLQMKHAGNVVGTPTLMLEYIFVRVVYTLVTGGPETYDSSANNIHCTLGNIHVKSGNILL